VCPMLLERNTQNAHLLPWIKSQEVDYLLRTWAIGDN